MKEWSCKLLGKTRRGLALMMSVSFVLSVLAPVCFAQAAKQTKPLLNAKTKSLYYDKSGKKAFTLKVKKNKVRMIIATNWKTSKKSVVALSKKKDTSVKLTAKKKGNATVTGTIKYVPNGKWAVRTVRLTCKVTSKQAPIAEQVPTVPNQIPMPTVAPLQPGMSGTGATSMPNNPSEPTLAPTDKTTEAPGETPYEPKETDLPPTLPTDQATEAPKETPYEPQETDLPTADQTATPTSPTDEATEAPEDSTDKPASNATRRPSRTFKPTKTTTPRPTSTGRPASSDFDVLSMAAVLPKADASVVNKVFSDVDTFSITNGKLVGTFDTINESVVLDLGREVDMNAYRGVEVKGVIPGQIALEFYDSGLDMTQTWDNGADKDWWETASGKTYPFYIGSCAWRYEDGAMNYLKAVQNGATKWSDTKVAPTEETQRFSLNKMAQYSTGDWSRIRYIVVTSNKSPSLSEQGRFDKENVTENRTPFTYRITGLKFLAEGVVDATDEGHYIIDTKMAAETSGNVKSYYADVVTEDKPANQRNTAMNFSDFKYICVQVKDTKKVKVGIMAEGETLADAVVVGEETGSGQRIVYFRVDTEENKELLKAVDAVSVQIDSGGTILKLSGTKGEIGFKDGVTKVDVVPDGDGLYRSTIVTSEKYGNNNYGTVIVPTASPKPTPNIIDLDEYTLDLKSQLWTNGFYDRTDNADGSITLKRQRGDLGWQVGEFGFAVPRDKVGDLHEFTEVIIRYRDSDLTDDLTKCGYVFHMGDDTEVGWIESEDGGHPNTLSFDGSGQISIYAGETKSGQSEKDFSSVRIYDGKTGGKITIESITLAKGKTPATPTPNPWADYEKPVATMPPYAYVPQGPGWQKLDLSAWSGDNDNYIEAGDQVVLSEVELETVPLPRNLDAVGDKIEVLIRGSVPEGSNGFRYWGANDNGGTLTTMGHYSNFGEGVEDSRNADDPREDLDPDAFQAGQFQVQRVLEHINKDGVADDQLTGTELLLKGASYAETLDGIIITGIWVRYGEDIGKGQNVAEVDTDVELTKVNSKPIRALAADGSADASWEQDVADENVDGSITFHTTAIFGGGGRAFSFDSDKWSSYSKVKITLSVKQADLPIVLMCRKGETDGKAYYLSTAKAGEDAEFEVPLEAGADSVMIQYNGWMEIDDRTDEEKQATRADITVKSIKFVK